MCHCQSWVWSWKKCFWTIKNKNQILISQSRGNTKFIFLCSLYVFRALQGFFVQCLILNTSNSWHSFTNLSQASSLYWCIMSLYYSHWCQFSSVQFSRSVVSDSLRLPWGLQHARPPCPSPTPGVHSDSHPSSRWCHPAISSSVIPFSSCPNPSQHQSLFQEVNSSHEVAKVLEFQL